MTEFKPDVTRFKSDAKNAAKMLKSIGKSALIKYRFVQAGSVPAVEYIDPKTGKLINIVIKADNGTNTKNTD